MQVTLVIYAINKKILSDVIGKTPRRARKFQGVL